MRGDGDVNANGDTEEDGNEEAEESEQRPIPAADGKPALSGALTAELLAQRTAGLRAQVMERPGLALRLVVQSLLLDGSYQRSVARISGHGPYLKAACPTINETKAGRMLADEMDRLGQHQPGRPVDVLPWLLSLHQFRGDRCPGAIGRQHDRRRDRGLVTARPVIPGRPDRPSGRGEYVRLLDTQRGELFRAHHQGADRASGA